MRTLILFGVLILFSVSGVAQQNNILSAPEESDSTKSDWQFEGVIYDYILPNETDYLSPVFYADYKSIHFEARYNYEDKNTASVFGGYRFETGSELIFGATPIAGFVFGNTDGVAPGLLIDITYKKFDFYSESEYVFDFSEKENNFFYTWSELAVSPFENFRTGFSASRTRLYQTDRDIQHGIFAQYSFGKLTGGLHYFNPFTDDYFLIATMGFEF
ncbi:MAG: hypothetical protein ACHQNT_01230 [Bacteroidia bacterium]